MKIPAHQAWPDGTRVRFTERAKTSMKQTSAVAVPLTTPEQGADAIYTIDNTDDSFHDVILRETGERYGVAWLATAEKHLLLDEVWTVPAASDAAGAIARKPERAIVVCLCGSTRLPRSRAEFDDVNRRLTLTGSIVLAPTVFTYDGEQITMAQECELAELHLRKIDIADEVLVLNTDDYVGEQTEREIAYARKQNKPLYFLSTMQPL